MVPYDEEDNCAQCVVYDKTPGSEQKKINIIVRPNYTVTKVISDITTQFRYDAFELVLQPTAKLDLVFLNDFPSTFIYDVPGFQPATKNVLILLPTGEWDGNVKRRYDISINPVKHISNGNNSSGGISLLQKMNNNNNSMTDRNMKNGGAPIIRAPVAAHEPIAVATDMTIKKVPVTETLNLSPISDPDQLSDDDLALGASASPTETEPSSNGILELAQTSPNSSRMKFTPVTTDEMYQQVSGKRTIEQTYDNAAEKCAYWNAATPLSTLPSTSTAANNVRNGFVGLVNQAMTCYLNSLLQALYMTPEFRNALYRWEFDNDHEAKNIPYQLQKIFLKLQTSKKSAVETTDLTRSFGWDSNEAWQQHDIQELCRVMFDALEHKFRNTKQSRLISSLYEGKMIDYVKCLECNTEKTRGDSFLDIPLPVRPFGSTVAYGSIEEALRAFVQPETLDGNNQYFCEKCDKKCNAHKGLKFKSFPYVLTLHLKRFDFDYQTMHRIKLNDKVTFPQKLNLNSFLCSEDDKDFANLPNIGVANVAGASVGSASNAFGMNGHGNANNTDDCSTTDSGSAMEEDNCSIVINPAAASSGQQENDMNEDDEGIDLSTSTDHRVSRNASVDESQAYNSGLYELFAIMIHAGSASGGHYYAYIKEFEHNEWYCFNDQSVTPITEEDIKKSFGGGANGGSSKGYYTTLFNSSTNAYMLMYRQIDLKRNERPIPVSQFPEHINSLLASLQKEEHMSSGRIGRHSTVTDLALPELIKPRVYFYNPKLKKLKTTRIYLSHTFDVNVVLDSAYQQHNVEEFAPLSHCRLVGYSHTSEEILQSFEDVDDPSLQAIRSSCEGPLDFLLEYRADGQEFDFYKLGGCTWYVYIVDLATLAIDGPHFVYSMAHDSGMGLRRSIAIRLNVNENEFLLSTLPCKKAFVTYDPSPTNEAHEQLLNLTRSQFRHLSYVYLNVPSTDPVSLEVQGIPSYEPPAIEVSSSDVVDAVLMNDVSHSTQIGDSNINAHNGYLTTNECTPRRESPVMPNTPNAAGHESNSEDSSLSDGDRTLVESTQNRGGGDSQISSTSHSPQLSSPEDESTRESLNRIQAYFTSSTPNGESDYTTKQYFHSVKIEDTESNIIGNAQPPSMPKIAQCFKIMMDSRMKMEIFKQHIESLIRVPANYFKIQRKYDSSDNLTLNYISEGETLHIELGKVLQQDEHKAKIFFVRLSEATDDSAKMRNICDWVYSTTMTVAEAKKDLVAKMHRIDEKYESLTLDNCRIWLKGGRNPIKILADDELLSSEFQTSAPREFIVQQCEPGVVAQPSESSLTIFIRRWYADELKFGPFEEITLAKDSEIRSTIAKITDIPEENIAYCRVNSYFPCTHLSLLNVNSSMNWFSIPATMDKYPLSTSITGNFYFYKDVTKLPRELNPEERRSLTASEKIRLDRLGGTSSRYTGRERGLKIHIDTPHTIPNTSIINNPTATTEPMDTTISSHPQI